MCRFQIFFNHQVFFITFLTFVHVLSQAPRYKLLAAENHQVDWSQKLQFQSVLQVLGNVVRMSRKEKSQLATLYEKNNWHPFFVGSGLSLTQNGRTIVRYLDHLEDEALNPASFPRKLVWNKMNELAILETSRFSPSLGFLCLSSVNSEYSLPPFCSEDLHRDTIFLDALLVLGALRWVRKMNPFADIGEASRQFSSVDMEKYLSSFAPRSWEYTRLCMAFKEYRRLSNRYGPEPLKIEGHLKYGDQGEAVAALQQRLKVEGFYEGEINGRFDRSTEIAVKEFQRHHLLEADGVVGPRTLRWLNLKFLDKVKLLADSLNKLRNSYTRCYNRYLRINIPEFVLEYYNNGELVGSYRIIVGKAASRGFRMGKSHENHTPSLVSYIKQIIFNPRWYVPERIRAELDEKIAEDPEFLEKNGFVTMNSYYSNGLPRIYQEPGPTNPLGRVKFEFPNPYNVYLHDTPEKQLFRKVRRDFSHGCIRVENAISLAQRLLVDDKDPRAARVQSYLERDDQVFVPLKHPIPIIIEYITVIVNTDGELIFCGDPYNHVLPSF